MLDFLSIGYRGFFSLYIKQILHYLNYWINDKDLPIHGQYTTYPLGSMVLELIEDIIVSQMTIGGNFTFILKPESCNKSTKR